MRKVSRENKVKPSFLSTILVYMFYASQRFLLLSRNTCDAALFPYYKILTGKKGKQKEGGEKGKYLMLHTWK